MKKPLIIFALLFFLTGCGEDKIQSVLEDQGYTNIELTGVPIFECGKDDNILASQTFTATKEDRQISGAVCCGLFLKGCTLRF